MKNAGRFSLESLKGIDYIEDLDADGRALLN